MRQAAMNDGRLLVSSRHWAAGAWVTVLLLIPMSLRAVDDPFDDEPDDRLPRNDRALVAGLIQRGMPELVEELVARRPKMFRVHVARAYAKAALEQRSTALREGDFEKAADAYRKVIALEQDHAWFRGERRRFRIAEWRVEYADMNLRYWIAPDLDKFEITSGLEFDRDFLLTRLGEAYAAYGKAGKTLRDLDIGLRTDEERYLLLGIADEITVALGQQQLNGAWSALYLAMVEEKDARRRPQLLAEALGTFDAVSQSAWESERGYNALLGAGIALREAGRFDEAVAAFDRVFNSNKPALTARAAYEKARLLIESRRFDPARRELDRLARRPTHRADREGAGGAVFYVQLAPLIHAYAHLREAEATSFPESRRKALRQKAHAEFVAIAERGGAWPEMAHVYLDRIAGVKRDLSQMTNAELLLAAGRLMSKKDYNRAREVWRHLLEREDASLHRHQARFNLGVCFFQVEDLRSAARVFLEEARSSPPPSIAEKAFEYAYRSWRQLAASSKSKQDYAQLAEAAGLLSSNLPDHPLAAEASWVSALALEEAGAYREALRAYGRVPKPSTNYRLARRNAARCKHRIYETLRPSSTTARRRTAARRAADAWLALAADLEAVEKTDEEPTADAPAQAQRRPLLDDPETRSAWIDDARLAAASLLVGEDLGDHRTCLELLGAMAPSARVLGLQIRCFQELDRIEEANRALENYLGRDTDAELGGVLMALAAEMQSEIERFRRADRRHQARRLALDTIPTVRHLLRWIRSRPEHAAQIPIVQYSLVETLILAEQREEGMTELEALLTQFPKNGAYLRTAAVLQEEIARSTPPTDRPRALEKAETLWARLLNDPALRDSAPGKYWEARYHWLRHQLRRGQASEVLKGIKTERAWYPDLGGPPWKRRLLDLAEEARRKLEAATR